MSEVFSVLLHNRQRYEQGKEGLWFSLPTTTEKLQRMNFPIFLKNLTIIVLYQQIIVRG